MDSVSIVIPTFNRTEQLSNVIDHLLKSDVSGLSEVQIIIVDDGSPISSKEIVEKKIAQAPFGIQYVRQENAGPAAARNNGFRHATHDIVLFIDDDILVFPDLIAKHLEGHRRFPQSIIYGYCPYEIPRKETPSYRFLKQLSEGSNEDADLNSFRPTRTIASGNISIEKKMFPGGEFYKSSLRTPAAEEFELMARLAQNNVKIFYNLSIEGWHLQPTTIEDKCKQEYKYGIGVTEVAVKVPYSLDYAHLQSLYDQNREILDSDPWKIKFKKRVKSIFAKKWSRNFLLRVVKGIEIILPFDKILFPCYRVLGGIFIFAGIRDGLKKFTNADR